ncbi:MAG: V-type ATPase subunit [Bacillota bacterium]
MNPYMPYGAVSTKILAKNSRIFDKAKLEKLMECNTVEQVAEYLKDKYGLGRLVDEARLQYLHRDKLEMILQRYKVREVEDILHYLSGPYKEFASVYLMESEIHDLVLILRRIAKGEEPEELGDYLVHSEKMSGLPYEKLAASRTIPQFVESLRGTPYYNVLKTVTDYDVAKREFHIEMKLYQLYYGTFLKKAEKLDEADNKAAREIIGSKIDFLNVQWIYRAKKYYEVSPEQMLIYCLPGGVKLGSGRLKKLCYTKSVEEIKQLSAQYLKFDIFTSDNGFIIEKNIENYMFEYLKKNKFRGNIGFVLSFFYMLGCAIREFTTITEGVRYRLPKDDLKEYLIHTQVEGGGARNGNPENGVR